MKSIRKVRINNIPALIQIMAWCHPGDKPLSESMMFTDAYMCYSASTSWQDNFSISGYSFIACILQKIWIPGKQNFVIKSDLGVTTHACWDEKK